MSNSQDIRWQQRFSNYVRVFNQFEEAINYIKQNYLDGHTQEEGENLDDVLNNILRQGLI